MNIALVDIDSHNFPNLVLMKLSAWHKARGDNVFLLNPTEFLQGANLFTPYDKVYGACVFAENAKLAKNIEDAGGIVAGSGTGKPDTLPEDARIRRKIFDRPKDCVAVRTKNKTSALCLG